MAMWQGNRLVIFFKHGMKVNFQLVRQLPFALFRFELEPKWLNW